MVLLGEGCVPLRVGESTKLPSVKVVWSHFPTTRGGFNRVAVAPITKCPYPPSRPDRQLLTAVRAGDPKEQSSVTPRVLDGLSLSLNIPALYFFKPKFKMFFMKQVLLYK